MEPFKFHEVYSYEQESEKLIKYITNCSQKSPAFSITLKYLQTYSFILEDNYVDKDYLVDYSNFYARCHHPYDRFCIRIHFFTKHNTFSFSEELLHHIFTNNLTEEKRSQINDIYLGFIVLRPSKGIIKTIGCTCLRHYDEDVERNRIYSATRNYYVNLYGIPLVIKSMAFQEQDQTVAMCSSIALWSAFSVTGRKYQHLIPSPSDVTKLAISESSYSRNFPNEGLTAEQIAVAISKVGLSPLLIRPKDDRNLKALIYAYLKAGIPIVCGLHLYDVLIIEDENSNVIREEIDVNSVSFHAVTINGYSFENGLEDIDFKDGIRFYSNRMTKFYVHDDQLCPFTKMEFSKGERKKIGNMLVKELTTSWLASESVLEGQNKKKEKKIAIVSSLIIPLYHKIRISHADIIKETQRISKNLIEKYKLIYGVKVEKTFEWDIFLSEISEFKNEIIQFPYFKNKELILKDSYAKYVWRARAIANNELQFEIVFDATDSKVGGIAKKYIFYNEVIERLFELK